MFDQQVSELAVLWQVGHNSVELAMEWLISHPEELMEAAPPAPQPQADQVPVVAKAINLAPAQVKHPLPHVPDLLCQAIDLCQPSCSAQVLILFVGLPGLDAYWRSQKGFISSPAG